MIISACMGLAFHMSPILCGGNFEKDVFFDFLVLLLFVAGFVKGLEGLPLQRK